MDEFKVEIKYTSRQVSKKGEVMLKDYASAFSLDTLCNDGNAVQVDVDLVGIVHVINPKGKMNKEYDICVIIDKEGRKFKTGSQTCMDTIKECLADMAGCDEEWYLNFFKRDSKNYAGKQFLTCSVI